VTRDDIKNPLLASTTGARSPPSKPVQDFLPIHIHSRGMQIFSFPRGSLAGEFVTDVLVRETVDGKIAEQ
jgi:hypothetical protein